MKIGDEDKEMKKTDFEEKEMIFAEKGNAWKGRNRNL